MKKKIGICAAVTGAIIVLVLLAAYWKYNADLKRNVVKLEDIVEQVTIKPEDIETQPESAVAEKAENADGEAATGEAETQNRHDFAELQKLNGDVYAWITMPDTKVDYPILQSQTDNKYLDTNFDGSSGYPGCIYTNVCNSKSFEDYITVVYGHNMKNGEMFGSLHDFEEEEFFAGYDSFFVETPEGLLTYQLYAAVNYDDKLIPAYYDVKSVKGRDEFVDSLKGCKEKSKTYFKEGMEIAGEDKLLVLSVCIKGQDDRRYLIVGKLV